MPHEARIMILGRLVLAGWVLAASTGVAAEEVVQPGVDAAPPAVEVQAVAPDVGTTAAPAPAAEAAPPAPALTPAPTRPATPADDVRAQLDGTRWAITLTPIGGTVKGKPQADTVEFKGRTINSASLAKAGYEPSNYSLTVPDAGPLTWETMQTKPDHGVVFWKGEFDGTRMLGVMSRHPVDQPAEDFTFAGEEESGKVIEAPREGNAATPADAPAASVETTDPTAQTAAPAAAPAAPKKKKRGWLGR